MNPDISSTIGNHPGRALARMKIRRFSEICVVSGALAMMFGMGTMTGELPMWNATLVRRIEIFLPQICFLFGFALTAVGGYLHWAYVFKKR